MKRIMPLGVAAAAIAASLLFAAPASAEPVAQSFTKTETADHRGYTSRDDDDSGHYRDRRDDRYGRDHRRVSRNAFGQTRWEAQELRREALDACHTSIARVAWRGGFRDVDFDDDRRVYQYARYGFTVRFDDVEFERYNGRENEREITCVFDRGEVVRLDGLPERRGRGPRDDRGWRGR